jgi:hypothetical protein
MGIDFVVIGFMAVVIALVLLAVFSTNNDEYQLASSEPTHAHTWVEDPDEARIQSAFENAFAMKTVADKERVLSAYKEKYDCGRVDAMVHALKDLQIDIRRFD